MRPSFEWTLYDQVGGQGRSGNFAACEGPFTGSAHYFLGDVMGKDTEVKVEPCDHVVKLVETYSEIVRSGKVDPQWPERTLACHRVMAALFASVLTSEQTRTVSVGLQAYASEANVYWNQVMAASLVVSAPIVVAVLLLQRHITSGLTAGAVK